MIIVRSPIIQKIVNQGIEKGALRLDVLGPEEIIKSQEGGFRHRRDLLAFRIALLQNQRTWFPEKRVNPSLNYLDERYNKIAVLRTQLAEKSHLAFKEAQEADDFDVFKQLMQPLLDKYNSLYKKSFASRAFSMIGRPFRSK